MLPLLFWFGLGSLARGLAIVVLFIVSTTGWLKDYVSTNRPKSPPIVRLSFNSLHELEYGFPSTHSAYAIGCAIYLTIVNLLNNPTFSYYSIFLLFVWFLAFSVLFGRIYCGMHSPIDVYGGITVGALVSIPLALFYNELEVYVYTTFNGLLICSLITFIIFYYHPTFADKCLCYQDTFSALSVIGGIIYGSFLFSINRPISEKYSDRVYFNYHEFGLAKTLIRIVFGLVVIATSKLISSKIFYNLISKLKMRPKNPDSFNLLFGNSQVIYSPKNISRIPVYFGIGFTVVYIVPWLFYFFNL
ncbi:Dihydrosphingosine 1-phosphate phosphatase [Smittium culicis]|uniref:Dihydrosphingosine 1-phosphate phosphatase n=1 Tax=Smittium culicis TaxID=133412 RepID=A0A1R1XEI6_9FUNG|nr:Dihydrosphingosine 1-phosphate phosphatase [Smittium culicis]